MFKTRVFIVFLPFILASLESFAQKNQTDNLGLKQGYWEKIDPSTGKIAYKGNFKNDKPQGVFYYYYKGSDSLHTQTEFRQGGKIAYVIMYHLSTGKMQAKGKYLNQEKDSVWNFYNEQGGLLAIESYSNGKKHGPSRVFYENGNLSEEKSYKNNLEEGSFKQFYDDKKPKAEGAYKGGNFDGKCVWFYPNGIIAAIGVYENKNKKGLWIYRDQSGKVTEKELWQNGQQLSDKELEVYLKKNKITIAEPKASETKSAPKSQGGISNKMQDEQ